MRKCVWVKGFIVFISTDFKALFEEKYLKTVGLERKEDERKGDLFYTL